MTKVKKLIFFGALTILALSYLQGVTSYSSASIRSPAGTSIVSPDKALISMKDKPTVDAEYGSTKVPIEVTNNTSEVLSFKVSADSNQGITIADSFSLGPGCSTSKENILININVTTGTTAAITPVEVTFLAESAEMGFKADIKSLINVNVINTAKVAIQTLPAKEHPKVIEVETTPTDPSKEQNQGIKSAKTFVEQVPITQVQAPEQSTYQLQQTSIVQESTIIESSKPETANPAIIQEVKASPIENSKEGFTGGLTTEQVDTQSPAGIVQEQPTVETSPLVGSSPQDSVQGNAPTQGLTTAPVSALQTEPACAQASLQAQDGTGANTT